MSAPSPLFGFIIDSLGFGEIGAVAVLAMIVVGPERFPELARGAGRTLAQFKRMIDKMSGDIKDISSDPAMAPLRDLGEFALRPKQKLAELIREAELDLQLAEQRAATATGAAKEAAARQVAESEAQLAEIEAAMTASTEPRPVVSEPESEKDAPEELAAEEPVPEEPAAEELAPEELAAEEPVPEEPAAEELAPEELAAEELAAEEPVPEEPAAEELAPEEPAAEEPAPEEPAAEELAASEPSAVAPEPASGEDSA